MELELPWGSYPQDSWNEPFSPQRWYSIKLTQIPPALASSLKEGKGARIKAQSTCHHRCSPRVCENQLWPYLVSKVSWHMTLYSTQPISVLSLYHKTSPKPMVGRHCDIVFLFRQSANTQKHMWSPCTILSNKKKNTYCYNTTFGITD